MNVSTGLSDPAAVAPGAALMALLRDGVQYDPLYPHARFGSLTDHLPMALVALHALGASAEQLQAFAAHYRPRLVPRRTGPALALGGDGWRAALGRADAYPAFASLIAGELAAEGRDVVLRRWVGRLFDAVAVDALHPLIRVAAGTRQPLDDELAAGLAYWCVDHRVVPLPTVGSRRDAEPPEALFAHVRAHPDVQRGLLGGVEGFGARLKVLAAQPVFAEISGWRPANVTLSDMAREAARIYLGTGDFFALHMVTGSHALRLIAPYVQDETRLLDRWWQGLAATYVIIGAPDYSRWRVRHALPAPPAPAASRCVDAAMHSMEGDDPEHVAKLLWSAREELAAYGHPEHAWIVARAAARYAPS